MLAGDNRKLLDTVRHKPHPLFGLLVFALPSLLGVYLLNWCYISEVAGWSYESYVIVVASLLTLCWDLYYTSNWECTFIWHKNHVLGHLVFVLSEYSSTRFFASKGIETWSFNRIFLYLALCIELVLFFPHLVFSGKREDNLR